MLPVLIIIIIIIDFALFTTFIINICQGNHPTQFISFTSPITLSSHEKYQQGLYHRSHSLRMQSMSKVRITDHTLFACKVLARFVLPITLSSHAKYQQGTLSSHAKYQQGTLSSHAKYQQGSYHRSHSLRMQSITRLEENPVFNIS